MIYPPDVDSNHLSRPRYAGETENHRSSDQTVRRSNRLGGARSGGVCLPLHPHIWGLSLLSEQAFFFWVQLGAHQGAAGLHLISTRVV